MARVNVYLPDELASAARAAGINVSNLTQEAIRQELARRSTDGSIASPTRGPHESRMALRSKPCTPSGTNSASVPDRLVVDAPAMVDLLLGNDVGIRVESRLRGHELHAPAHLDAEVLAVLGRLHGAGELDGDQVSERLDALTGATIDRHPLQGLVAGAWARRHTVRLADALYIELAEQLGVPLLTTDAVLAGTTDLSEVVANR